MRFLRIIARVRVHSAFPDVFSVTSLAYFGDMRGWRWGFDDARFSVCRSVDRRSNGKAGKSLDERSGGRWRVVEIGFNARAFFPYLRNFLIDFGLRPTELGFAVFV